MVMLKKGDHVWIESSIGVPIGGYVKVSGSGQCYLVDDEGKEHHIPEGEKASLKPMHPTSVEGVDDMIRLGDLSEAGLLRNLLVRHKHGMIYTYIGSVLVAMNPYQMLPIYTAEQVDMYHGRKLGELPPHIFAIADSCYYNMRRNNRNQCCIISGESGAGKTESTKLILQFLAAVSGQHSWIEQQIIQANPVLEAFGNAKTIRNDNSSRFGKYVEVFFNKNGVIEGAHMEQYLLEKSRVCHQAPQERNYHIFYCMLSGMPSDQKKTLSLTDASQFKYLTEGNCLTCDGRDDTDEFGRIRAALKILTFSEKDCWEIFKLLAAILHMGNVDFQSTIMNNMDTCDVLSSNHFSVTAKLLEVNDATLDKSLTHRSFMTNREKVTKPLNSEQAADTRDAFAKKTLDLLAVKPLNILALIDEESTFPKGTDATMLNKMNTEHNGNKMYISSKGNHGMSFGIKHFAGTVYYDCEGFLEKNRDTLSMDMLEVIHKSSNKLLKTIFEKEMNTNSAKNNNKGHKIIITPKSSLRQINDSRRQISTLSGQFRQSLDSLMKALSLCQPFFIRCFKPNDKKLPVVFDRNLCMQQLRYSGMLETIKIRKSGYPIRHTFKDFLHRYRVLLKTVDCDPNTEPAANCCAAICKALIKDEEDWKIGKSKVFLRDHHDAFLELEREQELYRKALIIQRVMLAHKDRANFVKKRRAVLVLQKNWRGHRERKDFYKLKQGFARLQARVRSRQLHKEYKRRRAAAITLQTQTRGYLARKDLKRKKDAVIVLQTQTRGLLARKTLMRMKTEAVLTAQEREAQERTALELQQRLEELLRKNEEAKSQNKGDDEMVENIFGFLPATVGGQEGPAPEGFEDLEEEAVKLKEVELVESPKFLRKKMKQQKATAKRKHSTIPEEEPEEELKPRLQAVQEEEDVLFGERATYDRPMTSLEKLHIIVGYAIVRQDIRDEIYCQILKQLTGNKNQKSTNRGWILLSICLGIFPPTDRLTKYLESFIHCGPNEYSSYCAERLRRTLANGERSLLSCKSVENKKPITVVVGLMDGRNISLTVDSASTSEEVCNAIFQKVKLQDTYGFSLYAAMYEKMWSLGSGSQHVLDAVSMCEQEEKRQGKEEQHAPWRLYFRKEIFTPWHDSSSDQVSTELIYKQVVHGLKSGDYQSDKEDDYVQLAARHYYVLHGSESSMETTEKIVRECMNMTIIENKSLVKLVQLVHAAHTKGPYINSTTPVFEVKMETVKLAQEKWTIYFSKFYEAQIISGPTVPQDEFVIVVNWKGVFFQDRTEAAFLQLSYPEVSNIEISDDRSGGIVCLTTPKGMYELNVAKGRGLVELVNFFISGLKKRSEYAVAIQDHSRQEDPALLSYRRGDVLYIIKDGEYSSDEGWIKARNERTSQTGAISLDAVRILPLLSRPTEETLNLLNLTPARRKSVMPVLPKMEELSTEKVAVATLKEFSFDYFSIEGRKLPPHQVEVDAIQNNSTQIFHKVHFPNDTSDIFEVTTTTRIKDLCRNIARDLHLSSEDGYSLFVKTSTKVVSMDSKEYFFDNLRQLTDVVIKKGKKVKEATPTIAPYLVLFMRKLWFNVIPGKDLIADLTFHFPQELPKYLKGYHDVSKEDMIKLAGLLFRVQVDTDKSQFVMIPRMLKDLVPADQHTIMTPDDWKKHIINAYNKQAGITVDEAKHQFLKTISPWPTFGCVFFEVKQTSEKSYPSIITLSISKQGVNIINPRTKEVLAMHLFSKITSWSSGNTYFHLTIGNLVQGNTLLCETSVGYRISDLLSSYKDMYLNEIPRVRKTKRINM
ncbi:unconventional myosin-VIIa-like protein [Labeo rohita]|uniref:Unconventional myosin-VIIa-like protein n=1 Tax=Labeo rohita TaxID=84645 RepID=A0A498LTI6_LABRO|nr:unconventional myosin-VIIa-like protein [Labeo rohita]RXN08713.1 unconventional myosin-VIIa-like protein [Labeo rohita]